MRISRVYFDNLLQDNSVARLATGSTVSLPAETSHYLGKVLRLKADDQLHLFNGSDGEFLATISSVKKNAVEVEIGDSIRAPEPEALQINLALGISRGDRMDYGIQKSTELGVSSITPLYTEFGEVRLKADRVENKLRHWNKIAISASEQSGRLDVPEVTSPCRLEDWAKNLPDGLNIMLEPTGSQQLSGELSKEVQSDQDYSVKTVNLIIGPEGGFSPQEIHWAEQAGFLITSLGKRILRTETAPVASLAIIQNLFGDM